MLATHFSTTQEFALQQGTRVIGTNTGTVHIGQIQVKNLLLSDSCPSNWWYMKHFVHSAYKNILK